MLSRLRNYFMQLSREDWEALGYLLLVAALVLLLPAVWFFDYLTTATFQWERLKWQFFLTESLRNWWLWILDNWRRLW